MKCFLLCEERGGRGQLISPGGRAGQCSGQYFCTHSIQYRTIGCPEGGSPTGAIHPLQAHRWIKTNGLSSWSIRSLAASHTVLLSRRCRVDAPASSSNVIVFIIGSWVVGWWTLTRFVSGFCSPLLCGCSFKRSSTQCNDGGTCNCSWSSAAKQSVFMFPM